MTYLDHLAAAVVEARSGDPTQPVTVLVSTRAEATQVNRSLACSSIADLRIGVEAKPLQEALLSVREVGTVGRMGPSVAVDGAPVGSEEPSSRSLRLAEQIEVMQAVRQASGSGYFASMAGLPGTTSALAGAVALWDTAGEEIRRSVLAGARTTSDRERLTGVNDLHRSVGRLLAANGSSMAAGLLECPLDPALVSDVIWIESVLAAPDPAIAAAWQRLRDATPVRPLDPGDSPVGRGAAELVSAVDPDDEGVLAARRVTSLLESGTAARDIVVGVPASQKERYGPRIAGLLALAWVPTDMAPHGGPEVEGMGARTALWDTATGRLVAAVIEAVESIRQPRDLRMDHLRRCVEVAPLRDADGSVVSAWRAKKVWKEIRGTDPGSWAAGHGFDRASDLTCAALLRSLAVALQELSSASRSPQNWPDMAAALRPPLDALLVGGSADGNARHALLELLQMWSGRMGRADWVQIKEDLETALSGSDSESSGGVRILSLDAVWAAAPEAAVICGLGDDQAPGVLSAVGPLTAEEVLLLRGGPRSDDQHWLQAAAGEARLTYFSYARSDLLRNVMRAPSRFLPEIGVDLRQAQVIGSVAQHHRQVESGGLGLLGARDAAAAALPTAGIAGLDEDAAAIVTRAVDCTRSRLDPPDPTGPDRVDSYNGDIGSVAAAHPGRMAPDWRSEEPLSASPSRVETLLGCPLGWWAQRVIGVDDPEEWDPPAMDQRSWGSWLHEAFSLLHHRGQLFGPDAGVQAAQRALVDCLGGPPDGSTATVPDEADDPSSQWLFGFRYRISEADVERAAADIVDVAVRLMVFLESMGGSTGASSEQNLGPASLAMPGGALGLGGRADRIDDLAGDDLLVTDFKTGGTGSGFQLAVYAWLAMMADPHRYETAHLLYATTRGGPYSAEALEKDGPTSFDRAALEDYLVARLNGPAQDASAGVLPSGAGGDDHSNYCPICGDLIRAVGNFGSSSRGQRAHALVAARGAAQSAPLSDQEDLNA